MYKGKFEESEENFLILSSISDKGDGKSFNPMLGGEQTTANPYWQTTKSRPRQGNPTDF